MLVIWDIDLTLLNARGFGHHEANALLAARGRTRPEGLVFAGRTDSAIWGEVLELDAGDPDLGAFLTELGAACGDAAWGGEPLPGVPELVGALARMGHSQTVATGNMAATGWLKLRHAGLAEYMAPRFASFGDGVRDRAELLEPTLADWGGRGPVVAVGDTPADALAAAHHGIGFLGVATGRHGADELRAAIAQPWRGPDGNRVARDGMAVVDDLTDTRAMIGLLEDLSR